MRKIYPWLLLSLLFVGLCSWSGWLMAQAHVNDCDGLMFQTDTFGVTLDMTSFHTWAHKATNKHPLFVLFITPWGVLLKKLFSAPLAVVIINSLLSGLNVGLAYGFFRKLNFGVRHSLLLAALYGGLFCNFLLGSLPERHMLGATSVAAFCYLLLARPNWLPAGVLGGILAVGVTVTNFLQWAILLATSLLTPPTEATVPWRRRFGRFVLWSGLALGIAGALSIGQAIIWPDCRPFIVPHNYGDERTFMFSPENLGAGLERLGDLLAHMFFYDFIAPDTRIKFDGGLPFLTFEIDSWRDYSLLGWAAVAVWAGVLAVAFWRAVRSRNNWHWLAKGLILCLLFNVGMHFFYGDDFLLYGVNWALILVAVVALFNYHGLAAGRCRRVLNLWWLLLLVLVLGNNGWEFWRTARYFQGASGAKWEEQQPRMTARIRQVEDFMNREGIEALYSVRQGKWINYAFQKRLPTVDMLNELSQTAMIKAELADHYAFADDLGGVSGFVANTRGSCKREEIGKTTYYYDLQAPTGGLTAIEREAYRVYVTNAMVVSDAHYDTVWRAGSEGATTTVLRLEFLTNQPVSCVRLYLSGRVPEQLAVEVETREGWKVVSPLTNNSLFFWSGPRAYWGGEQFCLERRFPEVVARGLRLVAVGGADIAEMRLYGDGPYLGSEKDNLERLWTSLQAQGVTNLYAGRYVANEIWQKSGGRIATAVEPKVFTLLPAYELLPYGRNRVPVYVNRRTAFVVPREDSELTRRCLQEVRIRAIEEEIGPWVVFYPRLELDDECGYSGLYWFGRCCFVAAPNGYAKQDALTLVERAKSYYFQGEKERAGRVLRRALWLYPELQEGLRLVIAWQKSVGGEAARVWEERLTQLTEGRVKSDVSFSGGLQLWSFNIGKEPVSGGVNLQFYWQVPRNYPKERYMVFVHFRRDGETVFQTDVPLLRGYDAGELRWQRGREIFVDEIVCPVPATLATGEYEIWLGLYDRSGDRVVPETSLKMDQKAVLLPLRWAIGK